MTKAAPSSISASRVARALALTALVLVAVDQGVGAVLDQFYARSTKSPLVRIEMAAPRNIVLGSSTGKQAIDPDAFLPDTYNAADNAQSIFYVATVLRNLPRLESLERVVVAFDLVDFTTGYRSSNLKYLWRVSPLGRRDPLVREWLGLGDAWTGAKLLSGLFPYRNIADSVIAGWWRPRRNGNGYRPIAGHVAAIPAAPADKGPALPVVPEAQRALEAVVAAADRLGVRLVAVVTPMAGRLRETEPKYGNAVRAIRAAFAAGGHCDLLGSGGEDLGKFARTPEYFLEGPHINGDGAIVYSRLLARLIARECRPRG